MSATPTPSTVLTNIGSIIEDLLFLMVKAQATLQWGSKTYSYKFANNPRAGVHLGFALAALMIAEHPVNGILAQLRRLQIPQGSKIYIAGHSQGASVATLLRSYLHYSAAAQGNYYKTYVFAQPKPANDFYSLEFNSLFSNRQLAYRLTNSLDWVPQVPFTLELPADLNRPNPLAPNTDLQIAAALKVVGDQVKTLTNAIFLKNLARLRNKTQAVLANTQPPAARPSLSAIDGMLLPLLLPSMNYASAASEIALIGAPCTGPGCDSWYQHHLDTYEALMRQQLT